MGKASRKMKKKQQQVVRKQGKAKLEALVARMQEQEEQEDYAGAIDTMAEIIGVGQPPVERVYAAAYDYFMLADYERAAKWVDITLTLAPGHIEARLLLGRICIIEDRQEDAFDIYEDILTRNKQGLSAEMQREFYDVMAYYGEEEADLLQGSYPQIDAFLKEYAAAEKN